MNTIRSGGEDPGINIPSQEQQDADFAQWEQQMQPERDVSPMATRIENAAHKLGSFLRERQITKAHGEALAENSARTERAQEDTLASYDSSFAATADRESLEAEWAAAQDTHLEEQHTEALALNKEFDAAARRERRSELIAEGKVLLQSFGKGALESAARNWKGAKSKAETIALAGMMAKDGLITAARTAQVRFAERAAYKEQAQRTAAEQEAVRESDHEAAFQDSSYMDQVHTEAFQSSGYIDQVHQEAFDSTDYMDKVHTEALSDRSYLDTLHEEASAEYQEELKQREAVRQKAYAARLRKARRQQNRQEAIDRLRTQTAEDMANIKGKSKRFGRAIAKFAKKAGRMAKGAIAGAIEGARAAAAEQPRESSPSTTPETTAAEQPEAIPTEQPEAAPAEVTQKVEQSAEQSSYDPWKTMELDAEGNIIGNKPEPSDLRPDPRVAPYESPES